MSTTTSISVLVEGVIWTPGADWADAVAHLSSRFARVKPFPAPVIEVTDADSLAAAVEQIRTWAGDEIDWRRELGRWFDENFTMYRRADATTARTLRNAAAERPLVAVSALPERALASVLLHNGVDRAFEQRLPESSADATAITTRDDLLDRLVPTH